MAQSRHKPTAGIVLNNGAVLPHFVNTKGDRLSGGKPVPHVDDLTSQRALSRIADLYSGGDCPARRAQRISAQSSYAGARLQ